MWLRMKSICDADEHAGTVLLVSLNMRIYYQLPNVWGTPYRWRREPDFESRYGKNIHSFVSSTPSLQPPDLTSIGYWRLIPREKSGRGVNLTIHLVQRSRNCRSIHPPLHPPLWCSAQLSTRTTSPLQHMRFQRTNHRKTCLLSHSEFGCSVANASKFAGKPFHSACVKRYEQATQTMKLTISTTIFLTTVVTTLLKASYTVRVQDNELSHLYC
jgi:hypothetical protein